MKLYMILLFCAFTIIGNAQEVTSTVEDSTQVKVIGADKPVPIGELIKLSVELVTPPKEVKSVAYSWTVLPPREVVVWPDQNKVVFGTGNKPTTYTVIVTAAVLSDGLDTPRLQSFTTVVTVKVGEGTSPVEPDKPQPDKPQPDKPDPDKPEPNNPEPPLPVDPNLTGLAKEAYDWVNLVKITNTYPKTSLKSDANKLAASFESIAAAVAAGVYKDWASILNATRDSNREAITNKEEWLPWFNKLSSHLEESYTNGTIKSFGQVQQAWKDIATGLKAAAK